MISMCPISCIRLNSVLARMKRVTSGGRLDDGDSAASGVANGRASNARYAQTFRILPAA
ncbi:hypothetical protein D3C76_1380830 [compost metagenome]